MCAVGDSMQVPNWMDGILLQVCALPQSQLPYNVEQHAPAADSGCLVDVCDVGNWHRGAYLRDNPVFKEGDLASFAVSPTTRPSRQTSREKTLFSSSSSKAFSAGSPPPRKAVTRREYGGQARHGVWQSPARACSRCSSVASARPEARAGNVDGAARATPLCHRGFSPGKKGCIGGRCNSCGPLRGGSRGAAQAARTNDVCEVWGMADSCSSRWFVGPFLHTAWLVVVPSVAGVSMSQQRSEVRQYPAIGGGEPQCAWRTAQPGRARGAPTATEGYHRDPPRPPSLWRSLDVLLTSPKAVGCTLGVVRPVLA